MHSEGLPRPAPDGEFRTCCGSTVSTGHDCGANALDPPRHCPRCGRRLVVQVLPLGWTARCSEHGRLDG